MPNIEVKLLQTYDDSTPPLTNPPTPISYRLRTGRYPINKIVEEKTKDINNLNDDNKDKLVDTIETTKNTYYLVPESDADSFDIVSDIPNFASFNDNLKLTLKNLFNSTQGEFIYKINNSVILNEELDLPRIPSNSAHKFNVIDRDKILKPIDLFKCGIIVDANKNFNFVRWGILKDTDKILYGLDANTQYAYTEMFINYTYECQIEFTGQTKTDNNKVVSDRSGEFKSFYNISKTIKLPYVLVVPTPVPPILEPKDKKGKSYPLFSSNMKAYYRDIYYYLRELVFDTNGESNDNHKLLPIIPFDKITNPPISPMQYHQNLWTQFIFDITYDLKQTQNIIDSFNKYGVGTKLDSDNFNLQENCNKNCWRYLIHKITNVTFSSRHYISGINNTPVIKKTPEVDLGASGKLSEGAATPCHMHFSLPPINTTEMKDINNNQLRLLNDLRPLEPLIIPNKEEELAGTLAQWTDNGNGLIPGDDPSIPRVYEFNNDDTPNEYSKYSMSELTKYLLFTNLGDVFLDKIFEEMKLFDKNNNNRYSEFYGLLGSPGREYTLLGNIEKKLQKQFVKYNQYGVWYRLTNNKFQPITPIIVNTHVKK